MNKYESAEILKLRYERFAKEVEQLNLIKYGDSYDKSIKRHEGYFA